MRKYTYEEKVKAARPLKNVVLPTVARSTLITIISVSFEGSTGRDVALRHLILIRSFIKLKRLKQLQELAFGSDAVKL